MEIKPKQTRVTTSVMLLPEAKALLVQLAQHYDTSQGQIVENMLLTYGPKLLEREQK